MDAFITALTIFVLATFVGFEVITKVPPILHTPLMSGANAVSGITLIGALIAAGAKESLLISVLGFVAVAFATINVVGGFLITHRMLKMFKRKE
ncbi:MAG: NAD(P) transhydrogenase subunit alpha [Deltaproteobacteria bacterium HGW-Deltaproteobacteria-6]|jgi:NAD(P) transhydrogenase subunit alpha|nr:MAG: NAD(P) transhydrogenase subunit alpha [Deltaproteobacteria bacterium HGW-Deltaproteobacteria-6]